MTIKKKAKVRAAQTLCKRLPSFCPSKVTRQHKDFDLDQINHTFRFILYIN